MSPETRLGLRRGTIDVLAGSDKIVCLDSTNRRARYTRVTIYLNAVAGAGRRNRASAIVSLTRTSASSTVDWPSVHVSVIVNGTFTPATSR